MSLGKGFTGVRQPEFDLLVACHCQAGPRLERLAELLHAELRTAGLDPTPALRVGDIARRVLRQGDDLRRRQRLIRELERAQAAHPTCTADGTFLGVPDGEPAAEGLLAARTARLVTDGDAGALARLLSHAARGGDPGFVRAFLGAIGAEGVTVLPAALVRSVARAGDPVSAGRHAEQARQATALLSRALAAGTDPASAAFAGDDFLAELVRQGRARHTHGDLTYFGYQAQALVWRAADPGVPYSARFAQVVGRDAVAFEHERYASRWRARLDPLGALTDTGQVALLDLATVLGLGPGFADGPPSAGPPGTTGTGRAVVDDLLHATAMTRDASQTLLGGATLTHLLTTRLDAFATTGGHPALARLLRSALTGQDPTSRTLSAEAAEVVSAHLSGVFTVGDDGDLAIADRARLDRLAPLRQPLAAALAARVADLTDAILDHGRLGRLGVEELDRLLAFVNSDDTCFELLIRAHTEHMRAALNDVPSFTGADGLARFDFDENGEIGGTERLFALNRHLTNRVVEESRLFGHLLETRAQALVASGLDAKKTDESLRTMVRDSLGLLPLPGATHLGTLAKSAFGDLLTAGYTKLTETGYDQIARHFASDPRLPLDEAYKDIADNDGAIERLTEQMIIATALSHGAFDDIPLEHRTFAEGHPAAIKALQTMTQDEYRDFLKWARQNSETSDLLERARDTTANTGDVRRNLGLAEAERPRGDR
ncbi:hypothetical protein [Spongiactinospora sp. TRM90649]|uniref:hypothetical protein n=1 Tax=Spongiactinospora sp. TRM90649 TaxID=3031114 RepID=UPI0023F9EFD6|nr:hypothetical protein [Spongiactinospora sp. TRM90649]MDF5751819.1 hypothetical protein [Spongiactinospora sp. TRM90649]